MKIAEVAANDVYRVVGSDELSSANDTSAYETLQLRGQVYDPKIYDPCLSGVAIETTSNVCIIHNGRCPEYNSGADECASGEHYCACDETVTSGIFLQFQQVVELVRGFRDMLEMLDHPQKHIITEDFAFILAAGAK